MGQGCSARGARASSTANTDELSQLVGQPVHAPTPGIFDGPNGVMENVLPGQPSTFYANTGFIAGYQLGGYCCLVLQYPVSSVIFGLLFAGQLCAPCCFSCLGVACCQKPSQINYIHALYVIHNTLHGTWFGYLCCGGWIVQLAAGVLVTTILLSTPPKFIFDEDQDIPFLMNFEQYVDKKKDTFPPFSGKYRAIDGGGNQETYTFLGQSGRGYAMSEPYCVLSPTVMPDPEEMQRALQLRSTFIDSPWGQNAIATWFANVAIHDFFRSATGSDNKYTGGVDKPWVNLHSSYLDLQVLYGWNKELADSVRTFREGKLFRVAENRFDGSRVPESSVIVEMMRREHNYVCDELAKRYPEAFNTDELLYQQARLIMGAVFINIILRQYGDQMFGEDAPNAGIFAELRQRNYGCWPACCGDHQTVGNHVSFNFNLIYRWHTGIPAEWDPTNVPPSKTDDEIRQIFLNAYNWKAGGFGPNNMPAGLFPRGSERRISVPAAAVLQARRNGAPRLNDFRRRFGTPYTSFEDMCGDPEVAKAVQAWYPNIEDVELSVGCQVEKSMSGGWNLGNTVGGAIIADAFSSIRQDRFYTKDYSPEVYTEWGYQHTKNTILVDLLNRHLNMGLPREIMLARIPEWKGPPEWSQMAGSPFSLNSFTNRGRPVLK